MNDDLTTAERRQDQRRVKKKKTKSYVSSALQKKYEGLCESATNYFLSKDFKKAKVTVTQAMRIRPTAALFALAASISEALGRFQEAGDLRLLQAFEAKDKALWQELLHEFIENGMLFRATVCLKRLAVLSPPNSQERRDLYLQLADLLVNLGETSGAIRLLVSLWGGGKSWDFDVFSTLSSLLFQLGKWHSLEKILEESLMLFLPTTETDTESAGKRKSNRKSKNNPRDKAEDDRKVVRDDMSEEDENDTHEELSESKEKPSKSIFDFMFKSRQTATNESKSTTKRHTDSEDDEFLFFDRSSDDIDKEVESPFSTDVSGDKDDCSVPSVAPWRPLKDEKEERDFMRIINLYAELLVERGKFSDCITMLLNVAAHFGIMLCELHPDLLLKYAVAQAYVGDVSQAEEVIEHLLNTPGKCSPVEFGDVLFDAADVMAKVGCFTIAEKVYRYLLRFHRGVERSGVLTYSDENYRHNINGHDVAFIDVKEDYFDTDDSALTKKNKEIRKKSSEIAYNYVSGPATEGLSLTEKRDMIVRDVALLYGIAKCCAKEGGYCGPFGQVMRKDADSSVSNSHKDATNSNNHCLQYLLEIHQELDPYHVPTRVLLAQIYKEHGDIEAAEEVLLPKSFKGSRVGDERNGHTTHERLVSASEALLNYHKNQIRANIQSAVLGSNLDNQNDDIELQHPQLEGISVLQEQENDPVVVELSRESGFQRAECDVHLILLYASMIKETGDGTTPFSGSSSQSFSFPSSRSTESDVHSVALRLLTVGIPILQSILSGYQKGMFTDDGDDVISVAPGSSSGGQYGGRRASLSAFGRGVISMPSFARTSSSIIPATRVAQSLAGDGGGGASLLSYSVGSLASTTHSIATSSRASQSKGYSLLSRRGVSAGGSSIGASTTALSMAASDMGASSSHYTQMLEEKDGSSIFSFKKRRRGEGGMNKSNSSTLSRADLVREQERQRHQRVNDNCSVGNMEDIEIFEALLDEDDDDITCEQESDSSSCNERNPRVSPKKRVRFSEELEVSSQTNANQSDDVISSQTNNHGKKRGREPKTNIKEENCDNDDEAREEDPYALPSIDEIIANNFGVGSIMGHLFKKSMLGVQEEGEQNGGPSEEPVQLLCTTKGKDGSTKSEVIKEEREVSYGVAAGVHRDQHVIPSSMTQANKDPDRELESGAKAGVRDGMTAAAAVAAIQDVNRIHDKSPGVADYIKNFGGRSIIVRLAMAIVDAYTVLGEYIEAKDFATYFLLKVNNNIFKRHGSLLVPLQISILRLSLLTNQIGDAVRATVSLLQQEGRVRMKRSCSEFNSSSSINNQSSIFDIGTTTSGADEGDSMARDVWEIVAALVNRGMKSGILKRLYKERGKRDPEILVIQANSYFLRGSYRLALPLYLLAHAASRKIPGSECETSDEGKDRSNGPPHLSSKRLLWPNTRGDILLLFMIALCYLLGAFVRTNPFRHEHVQAAFYYLQEYFEACCELAASRRYYCCTIGVRRDGHNSHITSHLQDKDIFPRELDKGVFGLYSSAALPFSKYPDASSRCHSYYEGQRIDEAMLQETLRPSVVVIEALYNIARCYQQLSLCYLAIPLYERVLGMCSVYTSPSSAARNSYQQWSGFSTAAGMGVYPSSVPGVEVEDVMCHTLAQAARYNLSCIYRYKGGNASLALETLLREQ